MLRNIFLNVFSSNSSFGIYLETVREYFEILCVTQQIINYWTFQDIDILYIYT